jgi:hypothetical protein
MLDKKKVPLLVKILSIIFFLAVIITIAIGVLMIVGGDIASSVLPLVVVNTGQTVIFATMIFAIILFFIALGLWKTWRWAKIVVIVFSAIGIISAIYGIILWQGTLDIARNAISLVIETLIGCYMVFSKKVKMAFSKDGTKRLDRGY